MTALVIALQAVTVLERTSGVDTETMVTITGFMNWCCGSDQHQAVAQKSDDKEE